MSLYALPSTTIQAILTGAPTGLVGTAGISVQVINASTNAVAVVDTTSGIVESPANSGIYIATITAPSAIGEYVIVWTVTVSGTVTTSAENLSVSGSPPTPTTSSSGTQAGRTLADLRSEILNHGFDGTIFTSSVLNQYLNDALGEVSAKTQYYGEEQQLVTTTVAGTARVNLPTGFTKIRTVRIPDQGMELGLWDLRDIDRTMSTTTGTPTAYALEGVTLRLYPVPNDAYTLDVRYWSTLSPLVSDSDSPTLPPRYHSKLCAYAIARCYEREDDPQQAQYFQAQWERTVSELKADLVFSVTDGPRQVKSQWDNGYVRRVGWDNW